MNLHEFQGKRLFQGVGIPIPRGQVADSPDQARATASDLDVPVVVKAQVHAGGRGKAGGVLKAANPEEAARHASRILGMEIKGLKVRNVLVEEAITIDRELYLGFTLDRSIGTHAAMLSSVGGVNIEEVATRNPEAIMKVHLHPHLGLQDHHVRRLVHGTGLDLAQKVALGQVIRGLWHLYSESDCSLAEINPLAVLHDGRLVAADSKIDLDDNALFRHPEWLELREVAEEDPLERRARELGLSYVRLDGEVGILGNGAGLVMTTLDVVQRVGGRAANFLDVGGGAGSALVREAMRLVLDDPNVRGVLVNIFGGITRCDEVARGILAGLDDLDIQVPLVIRLSGTNQEEGRRLLSERGLQTADSMTEAAARIVALTRPGTP